MPVFGARFYEVLVVFMCEELQRQWERNKQKICQSIEYKFQLLSPPTVGFVKAHGRAFVIHNNRRPW